MSPYPAAWTELIDSDGNTVSVKIYEATIEAASHDIVSGTLLTDGKTYAKVASAGGYIHLLSLQLPGKKRMSAVDFMRGYNLKEVKIVK